MARPDKAALKVIFDALLKRKASLAADVAWTHIPGEGRATVKVDDLEIHPRVTFVSRGDAEALKPVQAALRKALQAHPELDALEAYRLKEDDGVVLVDAQRREHAVPVALTDDRRHISAGPLQGHFLYELVHEFQPARCLELGTAYGVSTLYLLAATDAGRVTTVEADPVRRGVALRAFERFGVEDRVESRLGLFADHIPAILADSSEPLQFVFEDGPHVPEVTLDVFERVIDHVASGGILVFDDVYHHEGNEVAWHKIVAHPSIVASGEVNGRQGVCVKR
jgi:predicted O-methyltransferase YrrM